MAARNLNPTFSRREAIGLGVIGAAGVAAVMTGCAPASGGSSGGGFTTGLEIGPLSDVPVGAGRNFEVEGTKLVVTQPVAGEVHAFSAICTHEGCVVGCREKIIKCDCHEATFDPATGEVTGGPANGALPRYPVEVKDGVIYTA
jgi:nitrite reductase/ring-hydroxylating ferredoxin subunit